MPGMVNTHCHLGMVPFRGLGDDCKDRLRVFLLSMEQKAMSQSSGTGRKTGSIEPGKEADLVLVETDSPNMFPVYDPYSALVYSANASNVRDVYVAGTCLVQDKKLVYEDLGSIRRELSDCMGRSAFGEMQELHRL